MPILITGATGFVGQRLLQSLSKNEQSIFVYSRNAQRAKQNLGELVDDVIHWNPQDELELDSQPKFETVINLMGEPITEGRWTNEKKERIRDSRVDGTRRLVDALLATQQVHGSLPDVFISASAVGIYGDCGESIADEQQPHGVGFLTDVCEGWEKEANRLTQHGVRVINLRIGIVLGSGGGALSELVSIFKWGVGGPLGSGKQWVPWIHVDDLVGLIVWSIGNPEVLGPLNASAPNPVRNRELTKQIARKLNRPAFIPAPKFMLRIVLGEFANSLFFSQNIIPEKALRLGYSFQFSQLESALNDLL